MEKEGGTRKEGMEQGKEGRGRKEHAQTRHLEVKAESFWAVSCLLLCLHNRSTEAGGSGLWLHPLTPASSSGHGYLPGFDGSLSLLPHRELFYGTKNYNKAFRKSGNQTGVRLLTSGIKKCWLTILSSSSASQPSIIDFECGEGLCWSHFQVIKNIEVMNWGH